MSFLDALILGIIQGLTEFLPVSSSGHLVLAETILKMKQPGITLELLVHLGTLLSVMIYFRSQIFRLVKSLFVREMAAERRILLLLVIGTIPAGLAGVLLKDFFESTFSNPVETSIELIITGGILFLPRLVKAGSAGLSLPTVIWMGIGQAISILPGISRSGSTIVAGLLAGVKPAEAAEFSFLLSIPAIAGAIILGIPDMADVAPELIMPYALAAVVSFIFGLIAVYWVLNAVKRGKFEYFAYYCFAIGLFGLYLFL
ncbi:MAG: undecaprenyl-diphosphate phosphatase [candidate division Zixibacteria bacterium]|nr:undecaprenyl-diphosphate phosphatase [candidate division Zixibacteria bacterium]